MYGNQMPATNLQFCLSPTLRPNCISIWNRFSVSAIELKNSELNLKLNDGSERIHAFKAQRALKPLHISRRHALPMMLQLCLFVCLFVCLCACLFVCLRVCLLRSEHLA
jgi:hypothetical protein